MVPQPPNEASSPRLGKYVLSIMRVVLVTATLILTIVAGLQRASDFRNNAAAERARYLESERDKIRARVETAKAMISFEQAARDSSLQDLLRQQVYKAHAVATWLDTKFAHLPRKDRERLVVESVRPIRFNGGRGYFFMTRHDGVEMLFADRPELEGQNLLSMRSGDGKPVIQDMIAISTSSGQEGFYRYNWSKPGRKGMDHPKLSFVKQFAPFGWFIGTGEYVEDYENDRKQAVLKILSSMRDHTGTYLFAGQWDGLSLLGPAAGRNVWDVRDLDGVPVVQELVAASRRGGGFVTYRMPRDTGQPFSRKLSYVLPVKEWEWYVGTGVSIDAIDEILAAKKKAYLRTQLYAALASIGILALLLFFVRVVLVRFFLRVETNLSCLTRFLKHSVHGIEPSVLKNLSFFEFQSIAKNVETMVNQRETVQKDLRKEQERLAGILTGTNAGTWEWNVQTGEIVLNQRWAEIIGYTLEEISPVCIETWEKFFHPDDIKASKELLERHFQGELNYYDFEARMEHKNGDWVWVLDRGRVVSWTAKGKPLMMMGTRQDITARKQAEQSLAESQARFKALHNASFGGIAIHDQGVILECNQGLSQMTGYEYSELVGMDGLQLIAEKSREAVMKNIRAGYEKPYEAFGLRKNGEEFPIQLEARNIPYRGKQVRAVEFRDITERRQAEKELNLAHERVLTILDSIDSTVYVADMDTCEILFMNQKMITDFCGDKTGEICYRAFRKNAEPCECCTNDQLVDKEGNPTGVRVWNDKDPVTGRYYINYDRAIEWTDGRLVRMQIATDITDLKKMETQLIQAQKMESVGRLAGGVAHDFNNMLGVILGHVEFALEKAGQDHDLYADLKEIQTAAQRSADLTKQLLTFARKQIISPKVLDLNDMVDGMLNMLCRLIGEDIDLVWKPAAHIWPVKMDPTQIDQILANLCVNARDAISGVGRLTIETGRHTFDEEYCSDHPGFVPGDYVLLAVSDSGCGMDTDTLDNLFEPFFTTKEVGKGTGLGLATIYGIVKQNKGFINVYSEPGKGSTFRIYLPRFLADEEADSRVSWKKPAAGGTETILLVEDEPSILKMTRMMLERNGYSVISSGTPAQAVKKAKDHSGAMDLLITDVVMPEMNGRDLAEKIRLLYPGIRLLFMSGYTADVIAHQGVLDKGVAFIQKPFSMADLMEKVREVLDLALDSTQQ